MNVSGRIRSSLVESPTSMGEKARAKRWAMTRQKFPDFPDLRIVDLGGTVEAWLRAPYRPAQVVVVNLFEQPASVDWIVPVVGDACGAPALLTREIGRSDFDLVFSNAVLEHVGGHGNRVRFAESVHALAPRHWVQTPYRYFPIEPHWLFPGFEQLPFAARARIAAWWKLSHTRPSNLEHARSMVQWTELVSLTEMRQYFPESEIVHERVVGFTKSLVAVRT